MAKYFGTILTEELVAQPLKTSERLVLGYIKSFRNSCPHYNSVIAQKLGLSKRTVAYAIANLRKYGIIMVQKQNNNNYRRKLFIVEQCRRRATVLVSKFRQNNRGKWCKNCKIYNRGVENPTSVNKETLKNSAKIAHSMCKNCTTENREDSAKFALKKNNKKNNKNDLRGEIEQVPTLERFLNNLEKGKNSRALFRENFKSELDFQKAFYARNTLSF